MQLTNSTQETDKSSSSKWKCSSCSTINDNSDQNVIPCIRCHILNSETNLYRARCLYLLGNIEKPIASLLPIKTPFFIYQLAAPMVTITKYIKPDGVWLNFEIDYLYDIKHIEMYHIEKVKFEMYELSDKFISGAKKHSDFVVHNLTPYYNIFSKFIAKPYHGEFRVDIYVKCYGSNRISPKQTLKFDLLPLKTSSTSLNKNKRVLREIPVNKKDILVHNHFYKSPAKRQRINDDAKAQSNTIETIDLTLEINQENKKKKKNRNQENTTDAESFGDEELRMALAMSMMQQSDEHNTDNMKNKKRNELIDESIYGSFDKDELRNALAMSIMEQSQQTTDNNNSNNKPLSKHQQIDHNRKMQSIVKQREKRNEERNAKKQQKNRSKSKIVNYHDIIINGCGDSQCINPYCKSNSDNKYKMYSAAQTSKLAIQMLKMKVKNCNQFKKRNKKKREQHDHEFAVLLQHQLDCEQTELQPMSLQTDHLNQIKMGMNILKNDDIIITKVLVVLIFIEEYFGNKNYKCKAKDLPGVKYGKMKMIEIFSNKYNYDVIHNKGKHCTLKDVQTLGEIAKNSFCKGDYQSIMVIFSGHGDIDTLLLSDHQTITTHNSNRCIAHNVKYHTLSTLNTTNSNKDIIYKYNKINRVDLETYFDGNSVPNKAQATKLYFVDACRGGGSVALNQTTTNNDKIKQNMEIHPNTNRCVFYPNTEPYSTYDTSGRGGILVNALFQAMMDNLNKDSVYNFSDLQDIISEKAENHIVRVKDDNGKPRQVKLKVEFKTTMKNKDCMKIKFKKNPTNKYQRKGYFHQQKKIDHGNILLV